MVTLDCSERAAWPDLGQARNQGKMRGGSITNPAVHFPGRPAGDRSCYSDAFQANSGAPSAFSSQSLINESPLLKQPALECFSCRVVISSPAWGFFPLWAFFPKPHLQSRW